ncbi:extracellular solute-binding protein [Maridesulfovibrio sp.]|uniref:ABC transporter substrate-binding protein n=1 Tax=Maridesulfovibrio sp. TaxID=2795000 RepID=UPI0029CA8777|nr:extracellular solute-binding protein [Maridesulfovibrio sp.]
MLNKICSLLLITMICLMLSNVAQARTSISLWTTEVAPDRQAVIEYLVRAFRISNRYINVTVRGVEENRIAKELAAARANGDSPDIITCSSDLVVAFNKKGWMNSRTTRKVLEHVGRKNFFAGPLNKFRTGDKYCGLPFNGWIQGIWYRKDWFADKKLAAPDSWENILKAARVLHDPLNGRYGILIGTRGDSYAEQIFTHLALSAGVSEFNKKGKVVFDSAQTVDALEFYKELSRYTPPGPQWWRGRDFYMQGRLAMMFYSSFIMDDLAIPEIAQDSLGTDNFKELNGADYDYMLLKNTGMISSIRGTENAAYGVIHALGLLKTGNDKKQAAAVRLAEFLYQDDAYITWLHMVPGGMLPMLKHITSDPSFYRDAQGVFQKYSRKRIGEIVSGFDNIKSFSLVNGEIIPQAAQASEQKIIPEMIYETLHNGTTPAQAVHKAAAKMEKIK